MINDLDRIDWSSMSHADGPASDVPVLVSPLIADTHGARWITW
ncbi:hypothetical protein [Streptomyces sp. NPDC050538]